MSHHCKKNCQFSDLARKMLFIASYVDRGSPKVPSNITTNNVKQDSLSNIISIVACCHLVCFHLCSSSIQSLKNSVFMSRNKLLIYLFSAIQNLKSRTPFDSPNSKNGQYMIIKNWWKVDWVCMQILLLTNKHDNNFKRFPALNTSAKPNVSHSRFEDYIHPQHW